VSSIKGRAGESQSQILAWLLPARMATDSIAAGQNVKFTSLVQFSLK